MRIVIITNRLPVAVSVEGKKLKLNTSVGGVASGLQTYIQSLNRQGVEYVWIGWSGASDLSHSQASEVRKSLQPRHLEPVFLSQKEVEGFYEGFSNDTIWPLFHTFPSFATYKAAEWEAYQKVNQRFCEVAQSIIRRGDVVWVHDYHLMLLPKLLRNVISANIPIGFFLHIPFPDFEIYRLLPAPWRRQILEGLLGADMVGFHTYDYRHYFTNSVERVLGFEVGLEHVTLGDRNVRVDSFPMGIDFNKFYNAARLPSVIKAKANQKQIAGSRRLILSIDRLDYTKGIINRLQAYSQLLKTQPKLHDKIQLALIVVPSRTNVKRYQEMKHLIDEMVGQINGQFGSLAWSPIVYRYTSLAFAELAALYGLADVALVTPLRDGMNLVAKEYIASRRDKTGVLVLSEMAGSAQEMQEAVLINPNHIDDIANGLEAALAMPKQQQIAINDQLQARLQAYDVKAWAKDFIGELVNFKNSDQSVSTTKLLDQKSTKHILDQWKSAKRRLLLLDYDGTLVNFFVMPAAAKPGRELQELLRSLRALATVSIISGRPRQILQQWLKPTGVRLVAEHGAYITNSKGGWDAAKPMPNGWKNNLLLLLEGYCRRVPGSFIEEKDYSVVWHYRGANPELAQVRVKELLAQVTVFAAPRDLQVLAGNHVVEVSDAEVNKGAAVRYFMNESDYDFILAIGDDTTDENLFKALPPEAYSIKVGMGRTAASYRVASPDRVIKLLKQLTQA